MMLDHAAPLYTLPPVCDRYRVRFRVDASHCHWAVFDWAARGYGLVARCRTREVAEMLAETLNGKD